MALPGKNLSGRTKGAIVGASMVAAAVTGGLWTTGVPDNAPVDPVAACSGPSIFAGRAGMIPCQDYSDPGTQKAQKVVGGTVMGCIIGFASGGPGGAFYGCIGGVMTGIAGDF